MSSNYDDPWKDAHKATRPGPCRYRCGFTATLIEPGGSSPAHKVCAQRAAGVEEAAIVPLTDGTEDPKRFVAERPLGCGTPPVGQTSGRVCAAATSEADRIGTTATCQLCPLSPTYWRNSLTGEQQARLPGYSGPPPSGLRD